MSKELNVDKNRTAVLAMDLQTGVVGMFKQQCDNVVSNAASVLSASREAGLPIVYPVFGFRKGHPEIGARNPGLMALKQGGLFLEAAPESQVHPELAPHSGDSIVQKRRTSAFVGTDLELILRNKDIDTLVLMGITTSGVVLSTARHAFDLDYKMIILSDCCFDPDEEVHRVILDKILARQASVATSGEFVEALK
jgi:nicotinamidase-related amidase